MRTVLLHSLHEFAVRWLFVRCRYSTPDFFTFVNCVNSLWCTCTIASLCSDVHIIVGQQRLAVKMCGSVNMVYTPTAGKATFANSGRWWSSLRNNKPPLEPPRKQVITACVVVYRADTQPRSNYVVKRFALRHLCTRFVAMLVPVTHAVPRNIRDCINATLIQIKQATVEAKTLGV